MENNPERYPNQKGQPPSATVGDQLHTLQDDAVRLAQEAKSQGEAQFEQYRDSAAEQLETLAQGARSAVADLSQDDTLGVSHYVADMAGRMSSLADNLRGKSVDELLQQTGQLARDNPALFVIGSIAIGFGLSRFLKASADAGSTPPQPGDSGYASDPSANFDLADAGTPSLSRSPAGNPDAFDATATGRAYGSDDPSKGVLE